MEPLPLRWKGLLFSSLGERLPARRISWLAFILFLWGDSQRLSENSPPDGLLVNLGMLLLLISNLVPFIDFWPDYSANESVPPFAAELLLFFSFLAALIISASSWVASNVFGLTSHLRHLSYFLFILASSFYFLINHLVSLDSSMMIWIPAPAVCN